MGITHINVTAELLCQECDWRFDYVGFNSARVIDGKDDMGQAVWAHMREYHGA